VIGAGATLRAAARFFGLISEDNASPLFGRKLFQLDLPFGNRRDRREGAGTACADLRPVRRPHIRRRNSSPRRWRRPPAAADAAAIPGRGATAARRRLRDRRRPGGPGALRRFLCRMAPRRFPARLPGGPVQPRRRREQGAQELLLEAPRRGSWAVPPAAARARPGSLGSGGAGVGRGSGTAVELLLQHGAGHAGALRDAREVQDRARSDRRRRARWAAACRAPRGDARVPRTTPCVPGAGSSGRARRPRP
jgi:hypothetical protein